MYTLVSIAIITILLIKSGVTVDVCASQRCQCSKDSTIVHCDTKGWKDLDDIDFLSLNVATLTLINNILKFDTVTDRSKIDSLPRLKDLSINVNPLGVIPPFNNPGIRSLSLQDTSLTAAEFPSSYNNSWLQTISLSQNKIRSIHETDFLVLRGSKVSRLHIDSASISTIDQNAFQPLTLLQALSLKNNQLKSCEFLLTLPILSSINLDENQFTSLPQQLATPGKIKTYSFIHNSITVIDESSPLNVWLTKNYTNMKIYLANNPFDCCLSLWFIGFLKTSPQSVGNASVLKCATPSDFAGKLLIDLNPNEMNCGGHIPGRSWWTTGRAIGIAVGLISAIVIITGTIVVFVRNRRHPSRSGYQSIDEPYAQIDSSSTGGPVFPIPDDEDYDTFSTHTHIGGIRTDRQSEAPTNSTREGTYAADTSQVDSSEIQEAAVLPRFQ